MPRGDGGVRHRAQVVERCATCGDRCGRAAAPFAAVGTRAHRQNRIRRPDFRGSWAAAAAGVRRGAHALHAEKLMQPLVLAIEPDLRQAAIVKRIVREKVLADVTVVDSRDAALEAMRTTVPDVLLLSTLLSPRDEDELIAHLRTLQNAEHLQTHTIPQLA